MKTTDIKEKFIELRAGGYSFDKISLKLKVSKPTLIKWDKEFNKEITGLKETRLENILETYRANKEHRITRLAKELENAWEEFGKLDYKNLTKRELLLMIIRMEKRLIEETEPKTKDDEENDKDFNITVKRVRLEDVIEKEKREKEARDNL